MLAYDYPVLGVFWSMLIFFLWVVWFIFLFKIIGDIFRSKDMGGGGKALWLIFIILVPFLGVLVYVIARGQGMAEREIARQQEQQQAFQTYVQQTAGTPSTAEELAKLADLNQKGVLTDEEFAAQKAKLLT